MQELGVKNVMSDRERVEYGLARARAAIRQAARRRTYAVTHQHDFTPTGSLYFNPYAFHQYVLLFILSYYHAFTSFDIYVKRTRVNNN